MNRGCAEKSLATFQPSHRSPKRLHRILSSVADQLLPAALLGSAKCRQFFLSTQREDLAVEMVEADAPPSHLRRSSARPPKLRAPRPVRLVLLASKLTMSPTYGPSYRASRCRVPRCSRTYELSVPPKRGHRASFAAFTSPLASARFHNSSPAMAAAMTLTAIGAD